MLNGTRKNLSNLVLNCVTYLWDTTLEVVSKPHLRPNGCVALEPDLRLARLGVVLKPLLKRRLPTERMGKNRGGGSIHAIPLIVP